MDKALKSVLEWWDAAGVDVPDLPAQSKSKPKIQTQIKAASETNITAPAIRRPVKQQNAVPLLDSAPIAASAKTLAELKSAIGEFDAGILSSRARQCVFARGNPEADIMIIGEAPGKDEDMAGKPFIGKEGQLLDRMMASIGLTNEHIYMTTVVNWRLPQSRQIKPEDIDLCRPFINRHIELISPKIIVMLGVVSLTTLTGLTSVMKNRGQWQTIKSGGKDIPALPMYHPSFLLKQPTLKKEAWRDLLELRQKQQTIDE